MDGIGDRLASAYAGSPLMFWLWGSVLTYALATNIVWRFKDSWPSSRHRWLVQGGRFAFYLAIPYLALGGWPQRPYRGLLALEDMGFVGFGGRWPVTRWLEGAATGLGWGLLALLILILALKNANRPADGVQLHLAPPPWWAILIDVLYLEVHWAFYRGAWAVALQDVYAGIFLGLGLTYLVWSLSPFWRRDWWTATWAGGRWLRAALALVVTCLYLLTRNLWICLAVHGLLELALWQLGRAELRRARAQKMKVAPRAP
jgi:hypothetical protein